MSRPTKKPSSVVVCGQCYKKIEDSMIVRRIRRRSYQRAGSDGKFLKTPLEVPNKRPFWKSREYKFHNEECFAKFMNMLHRVCGFGNCKLCSQKHYWLRFYCFLGQLLDASIAKLSRDTPRNDLAHLGSI